MYRGDAEIDMLRVSVECAILRVPMKGARMCDQVREVNRRTTLSDEYEPEREGGAHDGMYSDSE